MLLGLEGEELRIVLLGLMNTVLEEFDRLSDQGQQRTNNPYKLKSQSYGDGQDHFFSLLIDLWFVV